MAEPGRGHDPGISADSGAEGEVPGTWSCRGLGQRRTGRGTPRSVEPTAPRRQDRPSQSAQEQPVGTAEQ